MWNKNDGQPIKERKEGERHTNETLMAEIFKIVEAMPDFERANAILDYGLVERSETREITNYGFDFLASPQFGSSEGIYLNCYISGVYDEKGADAQKSMSLFRNPFRLDAATFKTLGTSLEDMKIMGELGGTLQYVANRYINKNIELFEPNIAREDILLYDEAQKAKAEAQRAAELLAGAALIPRGLDGNLPNADLTPEQEAVMSSVDKANAEVQDLRSSASGKEASASNSANATAVAKQKMGLGTVVLSAQTGRTYSGRIVGITGSHPDKIAIQRISGNMAILHRIKDIAAETNIAVGDDVSITKGRDGKSAVMTREEMTKARESLEKNTEEREL
ncbi:hypothetical protein FACS1894167_05710 [Synergistales bacterium]|nr:hypothetical protein FACS1894167_05710 [Synergistales bacterium]